MLSVLRMRVLPSAKLTRRFNSYSAPKGAAKADYSNFFSLLGIASVIGGVVYVYRDPDVLPASVRKYLPIQEPKGHGMTLEEYEQWRAKQSGFPDDARKREQAKQKKQADEEEAKRKAQRQQQQEEEDDTLPPATEDLPIPRANVSPQEMRASLQKLLEEARENEAAFLADLKKTPGHVSEEDQQMLQAFKDEKARLKQQLKFIKSSK